MPLTFQQVQIIGECLRAAAYGPFIPDWEFSALFGLQREQVAHVADEWPVVLESYDIMVPAVSNALNNMLHYPSKFRDQWDDYISVDCAGVAKAYRAWLGQAILPGARGYFERLM